MRYLGIPTLFTYLLLCGTFSNASHPATSLNIERKCQDGSLGIVRHIEENPNQPTVFTVDCPSTRPLQEPNGYNSTLHLEKRQSCQTLSTCTRSCYAGTTGPTSNDCDSLDSWLTSRNQKTTVQGGQEVQVTWGSCLFRFTNLAYGAVTLCDTFWAPSSGSIKRQCLPASPAGGYCTDAAFKLDVCLNPDVTVTTPTSTSTTPAPVYATPTSTTTPVPQANNQQSSTPGASSTSMTGSASSGTASGSKSSASSSSATTHTVSYTNSLGLLTYSVELPEASASIAQAFGPNVSEKTRTNPVPAIVGAIFGVLAIIAILVALWFWRRRLRRIREQGERLEDTRAFEPARQSQMTTVAPSTSGSRIGGDEGYGQPTMGFGSSKVALMQRQAAPVSEYSDSPEHLFSPTQDSASVASTQRTNTSYFYQTETPVEQARPEPEGPRRSISARTLAQELAPNLSERDITRLADTIVARMQAAAPPVTHQRESILSGSEFTEPPPPWRASWNSRSESSDLDTRTSAP